MTHRNPRSARNVRDVLRLRFGESLSLRMVSGSLGISLTTVNDHIHRVEAAGLRWPLPFDLDNAALEARLFALAQPTTSHHPEPDWQKIHASSPI